METPQSSHVAVIGAGAAGLAMMKSLREEGFKVTGFEKREGPGGIWCFTEDPTITSVTTETKTQLSRFLTPFTDFPHTSSISRHPTGKELGQYYKQYADVFGLTSNIRYGVTVTSVVRDSLESKWHLLIQGEQLPRAFDKVVLATGSNHVRKWPQIENLTAFEGRYIHGQEYKRPETFTGQKVVVIGQGNSAGDCAVELSAHAKSTYLAHRRGTLILPRMVDGARFDRFASWKSTRLLFWLQRWLPFAHRWVTHKVFSAASLSGIGIIDPSWKLDSEYLYATNISAIMFNDGLVDALREQRIVSTPAVTSIVGPKTVMLSDGSTIDDVDTIIACTGYGISLDILGDAITYSRPAPDIRELPHLFHNLFAIDYPESLACLGYNAFMTNETTSRELAGLAIAQVWAGKSSLPSKDDMKRQIQEHAAWFTRRCRDNAPIWQLHGLVEPTSFSRFVDKTAGLGLYEHLGWTWSGIKFALWNPRLYLQMAYGVNTPHLYRYFDTGKRQAWPGAREAIARVNEESKRDIEGSIREWTATKVT